MNHDQATAGWASKLTLVAAILLIVGVSGCAGATPRPTPTPTPTQAPTMAVTPSAGPTATPTSTPAATFVVRQPDDGGPGITVTNPHAGWTFDPQFGAFVKGVEVANLPEATILLWAFPPGTGFYIYGDPCESASTMPDTPATTTDEISAALAAQARRDASEPADVIVDGYAGQSVTLHVPDDVVFDDCDGETFATYGVDGDPGARSQQGPGQIDELWILDVDGSIVVLDAMYRPDTPADLVEEMRSIAQSATFHTP